MKNKLNIKYKDIDSVIPYINNTRTHTKEQIEQIKASIKEFGMCTPIGIHNDTIIYGHARIQAMKELGYKEVPTVDLSHLTEAQKKAYIIADNKLALNAGWDDELLKVEIEALQDMNFDIDLLGFDIDELDQLAQEIEAGDWDDEARSEFNLKERFGAPPFSVLRADKGEWQDRKREWTGIGIKSGGGRNAGLQKTMNNLALKVGNSKSSMLESDESIFDPYLCELMYYWFNIDGGFILDPFAGGSVRGVVAEKLGMKYTGFDIRKEQIEYNIENCKEIGVSPKYITADSRTIDKHIKTASQDMIFSCPPYADLEVYSDKPEDLSTMDYKDFISAYRDIIQKTYNALKDNRFAVFVVGEVRSKGGEYYNFIGDTIAAFLDAGYKYYNEIILMNATGSLALRASKYMKSRKIGKHHQNILVFYKGDIKKITENYKELNDEYMGISGD